MTLKQLAEKYGYEVRHHTQTLTTEESIAKVIRPFEFSSQHGGTVDGFKFYNDFYLYPVA